MRVVMVALCNPISRMVSAPISSLIGLQMYCMAVLVLIFYLNEVVSLERTYYKPTSPLSPSCLGLLHMHSCAETSKEGFQMHRRSYLSTVFLKSTPLDMNPVQVALRADLYCLHCTSKLCSIASKVTILHQQKTWGMNTLCRIKGHLNSPSIHGCKISRKDARPKSDISICPIHSRKVNVYRTTAVLGPIALKHTPLYHKVYSNTAAAK